MPVYNIEQIVKKKIKEFNEHQKKLFDNLKKEYVHKKDEIRYDFHRQLDKNLSNFTGSNSNIDFAVSMLEKAKFKKKNIKIIANNFYLRKSDLEKFIEAYLFEELFTENNNSQIKEVLFNKFKEIIFNENKFKYLENSLKKNVSLFSLYILNNGFKQNFTLLNFGINNSNEGDGAEHIFVAKAMIAGFNASIVDVGSSGYDAVIENKEGKLLKVQVKSFTTNNFSRRGRDRGGEGIDSSNRSNKGKLVSSTNCDIFVAVNKKNAELFIFPKVEIDGLPEVNIKREKYMSNWENWSKINE